MKTHSIDEMLFLKRVFVQYLVGSVRCVLGESQIRSIYRLCSQLWLDMRVNYAKSRALLRVSAFPPLQSLFEGSN